MMPFVGQQEGIYIQCSPSNSLKYLKKTGPETKAENA